MVENFLPLAPP